MNPIMLATDGSPAAQRATETAIELAQSAGWPLRVVVVWHPPVVAAYGYMTTAVVPELTEAEREHAGKTAEETAERARAAGVSATFEVREGDPAEEICEAAEESGATLVVIGAHGWGAFKRFFFGSVSMRVLHEAPCGVLVVRARAEEPAEDERLTGAVAAR